MNPDKLFDYLGVEKSEASRLYPAEGEVRTLNQQSGDPEIPVMSQRKRPRQEELVAAFRVNPVYLR